MEINSENSSLVVLEQKLQHAKQNCLLLRTFGAFVEMDSPVRQSELYLRKLTSIVAGIYQKNIEN